MFEKPTSVYIYQFGSATINEGFAALIIALHWCWIDVPSCSDCRHRFHRLVVVAVREDWRRSVLSALVEVCTLLVIHPLDPHITLLLLSAFNAMDDRWPYG
nr:hypothetical protein CFP56_22983 [Quercus suber]